MKYASQGLHIFLDSCGFAPPLKGEATYGRVMMSVFACEEDYMICKQHVVNLFKNKKISLFLIAKIRVCAKLFINANCLFPIFISAKVSKDIQTGCCRVSV